MKRKNGFERRIRALETRWLAEPIPVWLPDGTVHMICGRPDYVRRLFASAFQTADLPAARAADLELIRRAVTIREPGGHMLELLRAILNSPVLEADGMNEITFDRD